jgi:hypothetical protein
LLLPRSVATTARGFLSVRHNLNRVEWLDQACPVCVGGLSVASTDLLGSFSGLSVWDVAALTILVLLSAVCVVEYFRWKNGALLRLDLLRVGVILLAALAGCFVFDLWTAHERANERRALDAQIFELTTQAMAPGSALACLHALAGEEIEASCEKTLFASPQAVAAAVTYVSSQLALLAAGSGYARRFDARYATALEPLRRAAEADRFGIVAHVLAMRDGCTAQRCPARSLLRDRSRVSRHLAERPFDAHVKDYASLWKDDANRAANVAPGPDSEAPATGSAPVASVRDPSTLFFPSSSSIPPVSIMNTEPAGSTASSGSAGLAETKTPRRPAQPQPRSSANAGTAPSAPLQLAPAQ